MRMSAEEFQICEIDVPKELMIRFRDKFEISPAEAKRWLKYNITTRGRAAQMLNVRYETIDVMMKEQKYPARNRVYPSKLNSVKLFSTLKQGSELDEKTGTVFVVIDDKFLKCLEEKLDKLGRKKPNCILGPQSRR